MKDNQNKEVNDIKIGMNSKVRNVIKYATSILKENNLKELKFSAVGGSIGKLLETVEVIKIMVPGLYQQNKITSVAYQTVDSNKTVVNQRLYPKMAVTLSLEAFTTQDEGTQDKMNEDKRKEIEKFMEERREQRMKEQGENDRPRRGGRGGFNDRGRGRGGFRDNRRGGYRENNYREGGYRENNYREEGRGRGRGDRGYRGFRGGRGGFRGERRDYNDNRERRNYDGDRRQERGGRGRREY